VAGALLLIAGRASAFEIDFAEPVVTDAFAEPIIEAVGDLDSDDDVDVVAVIPLPGVPGRIQIFRNKGVDGGGSWLGLEPIQLITVGVDPSGVAAGLIDGDAHLDLAVTNAGSDNVMILIGNGDGTFGLPTTIPVVIPEASAVVAADLTPNCEPFTADLAVTSKANSTVYILYGNGDGTFTQTNDCGGPPRALLPIPVGRQPVAILSDDFDNDDDPGDIVGASEGGLTPRGESGTVWVLRNDGNGNFLLTDQVLVGFNPRDLSAADYTGDSVPEITVVNEGLGMIDGSVSVLVNDGEGDFNSLPEIPIGPGARAVEARDLDGDADPDLAVVADSEEIGWAILVLENISPAPEQIEFGQPAAFGAGLDTKPNSVVAADMNEDTALDLVTVNGKVADSGGSVSVLLNSTAAPCPCDCADPSDGTVNVVDFLALIGDWGGAGPCDCAQPPDGVVNVVDFLAMLGVWGSCPE
jgi:hypothetical protein